MNTIILIAGMLASPGDTTPNYSRTPVYRRPSPVKTRSASYKRALRQRRIASRRGRNPRGNSIRYRFHYRRGFYFRRR